MRALLNLGATGSAYDVQFVAGYRRALQVGAVILLAGAVFTIPRVRRPEPAGAAAATPETAPAASASLDEAA